MWEISGHQTEYLCAVHTQVHWSMVQEQGLKIEWTPVPKKDNDGI